jgi:hypothetical protein
MARGLTATEQKIYDVLSDGLPHTVEELHGMLPDDLAGVSALRKHLSSIRDKIPPHLLVLTQFIKRKMYYRLARSITSGE